MDLERCLSAADLTSARQLSQISIEFQSYVNRIYDIDIPWEYEEVPLSVRIFERERALRSRPALHIRL